MTGANWIEHARAKGMEAAERLTGTCGNLHDHEEYEELQDDEHFCDALDSACFCCTACGWWFDQPAEDHPRTGEWVCEECFKEAGGEVDD